MEVGIGICTYLKDEEEGLGKGLQIVGKGGNKVGNSGEKE